MRNEKRELPLTQKQIERAHVLAVVASNLYGKPDPSNPSNVVILRHDWAVKSASLLMSEALEYANDNFPLEHEQAV
jgi:hypothetical protein